MIVIKLSNWFQHVLDLIPQGQPQLIVSSCNSTRCVDFTTLL